MFSPDGKLLASVNNDPDGDIPKGQKVTVRVWETTSGKLVAESPAFRGNQVQTVAFGKEARLFILGAGPICSAWDFRQGGLKVLRKGKQDRVTAGLLSPDGKSLAVGMETGRVLLLDPQSGQEQAILKPGTVDDSVTALAFAPKSGRLAVGFAEGRVQLWNLAQKKRLRTYPADQESEEVRALCFAPDGRASADSRVRTHPPDGDGNEPSGQGVPTSPGNGPGWSFC